MRRWLPLLLAGLLALGCAGCTKRQTVTVYRIETGGPALLHPETVTVPPAETVYSTGALLAVTLTKVVSPGT